MRDKISLSKKFFLFCLSFIAGVFFAPSSLLLGLFFLFFLFFFFEIHQKELSREEKRSKILPFAFCIVFFLLGVFAFRFTFSQVPEAPEKTLSGKVSKEPYFAGRSTAMVLDYEEGRVLVYTEKYADYSYGDILKVKGDFQAPTPESYANYLQKEGIYYTSFFPEIEKKGEEKSFFYDSLFRLRGKMKSNIKESLPVPHSLFLKAMILGDRTSFTDDLQKKLSLSGTRHITAISGMHIVIISTALFYFLSFLKIKKNHAALLSILFIILFVLFVGAPSSAVRAGIMGSFLLFSKIFYRETSPYRMVAFAGAGMLVFNPLLLHFDLGFQLSFLAVLGILSLHEPLKSFLFRQGKIGDFLKKNQRNERIADLLAVTFGAQILVFPLILYNFGHLALFSVPANLLLVPLLPFIMIAGFFTALTGFFPFAFFSYLLLSFVLFVVHFFSSLPFSAIYIEKISLFFIFLLYCCILYKTLSFHKKKLQKEVSFC